MVVQYIFIISIGVYLGWWLHELSHWILGKYFGSEPKIFYKWIVVPNRVKHLSINQVSKGIVKLYGVIPLIWWIPLIVVVPVMFANFNLVVFEIFIILITAVAGFSRGDSLALASPSEYKVSSQADNLPRGNGYVDLVKWLL